MWQSIGDLVPKSIKKAGIEKSVSDTMVCQEFDRIAKHILGEQAKKCRAVYVKDRVLWIAVLSNSLSNELAMYEQDIMKALADKFGSSRVAGLRFMV
ncbi:hypothetical protein CL632_02780 [bacterium]|jgi:hypothetical protein|nr:hypothetical protein [bacterium]MDP6571506.1 DUF721 domain-containing protein [Patescibacteria group bacterium]MDP6756155.1 DUF721 domain-containing protein [Patescibacteria group bacterium]|tara:strand:- start:1566 stop:1856 length:291 start_codon:yes stop_codon:yes gene_type:complete